MFYVLPVVIVANSVHINTLSTNYPDFEKLPRPKHDLSSLVDYKVAKPEMNESRRIYLS